MMTHFLRGSLIFTCRLGNGKRMLGPPTLGAPSPLQPKASRTMATVPPLPPAPPLGSSSGSLTSRGNGLPFPTPPAHSGSTSSFAAALRSLAKQAGDLPAPNEKMTEKHRSSHASSGPAKTKPLLIPAHSSASNTPPVVTIAPTQAYPGEPKQVCTHPSPRAKSGIRTSRYRVSMARPLQLVPPPLSNGGDYSGSVGSRGHEDPFYSLPGRAHPSAEELRMGFSTFSSLYPVTSEPGSTSSSTLPSFSLTESMFSGAKNLHSYRLGDTTPTPSVTSGLFPPFPIDPVAYSSLPMTYLSPHISPHTLRLEEQLYLERLGFLRSQMLPPSTPSPYLSMTPFLQPEMLLNPLSFMARAPVLPDRMRLEVDQAQQQQQQRLRELDRERLEKEREKEHQEKERDRQEREKHREERRIEKESEASSHYRERSPSNRKSPGTKGERPGSSPLVWDAVVRPFVPARYPPRPPTPSPSQWGTGSTMESQSNHKVPVSQCGSSSRVSPSSKGRHSESQNEAPAPVSSSVTTSQPLECTKSTTKPVTSHLAARPQSQPPPPPIVTSALTNGITSGEDVVIPSSVSEGCSHEGELNQRDSPSCEMKVAFLGELGLVPMSESAKRDLESTWEGIIQEALRRKGFEKAAPLAGLRNAAEKLVHQVKEQVSQVEAGYVSEEMLESLNQSPLMNMMESRPNFRERCRVSPKREVPENARAASDCSDRSRSSTEETSSTVSPWPGLEAITESYRRYATDQEEEKAALRREAKALKRTSDLLKCNLDVLRGKYASLSATKADLEVQTKAAKDKATSLQLIACHLSK
ncbi:unnamed protein product [Darwinula stevensoni]|uniref:Genetic suppressor element-like domain-containing protein n=1 Tax=Darwinula stevensoni TaxID=69355 RepID=A0A7R9AAH0_9CRUS|nr:unnamed protein product [Darwinula stevensoni]CAG0898041.1 unnamed protein product [Darwinula stevensoni]